MKSAIVGLFIALLFVACNKKDTVQPVVAPPPPAIAPQGQNGMMHPMPPGAPMPPGTPMPQAPHVQPPPVGK